MQRIDVFRERVMKLMEEQGLSMSALSKRANLDPDALKRILKSYGDRPAGRPRLDTLINLSEALGCPVAYLIGETDQIGAEGVNFDQQILEDLIVKALKASEASTKTFTPKQLAQWIVLTYKNEMKRRTQSETQLIEEEISSLEEKRS